MDRGGVGPCRQAESLIRTVRMAYTLTVQQRPASLGDAASREDDALLAVQEWNAEPLFVPFQTTFALSSLTLSRTFLAACWTFNSS